MRRTSHGQNGGSPLILVFGGPIGGNRVPKQGLDVSTGRAIWLVIVAPIAAVVLCGTWSYLAWHLIPVHQALRSADAQRRAVFWATDLPFWLFGLPAAGVGLGAVIHAVRSRQGWLCALMVLYYGPLFTVALLACILFTPFKPFA